MTSLQRLRSYGRVATCRCSTFQQQWADLFPNNGYEQKSGSPVRALLLAITAIAVIAASDAPQIMKVSWIYEVPKPGSSNPNAGASCSDVAAADPTAVHYWITGYFSGRNFDGGRIVGARTREDELIDQVKGMCQERPAIPLSLATQAVYEKIQKEKL